MVLSAFLAFYLRSMLALGGILLLIFAMVGSVFGVACVNGQTTTVSLSYRANGDVIVSVADGPITASKGCSIELTKWNDVSVANVYSRDLCSNFGATESHTFAKADIPSTPEFQFGKVFSAKYVMYSDNTYSSEDCTSEVVSLKPALCRGPNYSLSSLNVIKRPFNTIQVSVTNKPSSAECYYYVPMWNNNALALASEAPHDCTPATLTTTTYGAWGFGTDYKVRMVVMNSGDDISNDEPLCGVNAVTITPPLCAGSLSATDSAPGAVTVSFSGAIANRKCEVYLNQWAGTPKASLGLVKTSPDCSSVTFTEGEAGTAFDYASANGYGFQYAEFPISTTSTISTNPSCSTGEATFSFTQMNCSTAVLTFDRPDPYSQSITVSPYKTFGVCRITLTSYDGNAVSVVRVGLCGDRFNFVSDGSTIKYESGKAQKYKLEFFPGGDVSASTTCKQIDITNTPASPYVCSTTAVSVSSAVTSYVFSIPSPRPLVGICKLLVTGCSTTTITFPSCVSTLKLGYSDLSTTLGALCTFKWTLDAPDATSVCDNTHPAAATATVLAPITVSQSSMQSGTITLAITLSAPLTAVIGTLTCKAYLTVCNGEAVAGSPVKTYTNCAGTVTFNQANSIAPGDNCSIEVKALLTADSSVYGSSGALTFPAAGNPTWGSQAAASVVMYGDDCVEITWTAPESDGGTPILCYEVQRKDGAGSYYVADSCSVDRSSISCGFTLSVEYIFKVIAVNRIGRSSDLVSETFKIEYKMSAPLSAITSPSSFATSFVAGGFPAIVVRAKNPSATPAWDTATTDRLFVARLISRATLDTDTTTIVVPDVTYTGELPIASNNPPALTQVFTAQGGNAGYYEMTPGTQPPSGAFSLSVHSLEAGGLLGQYWSNPFLSGAVTSSRKDPILDFAWGDGPLINVTSSRFYDLVSIRWTGFVEASYGEEYTFVIDSNDHVRLWIDDVMVINNWGEDNPCPGICTGRADLQQSVVGLGTRKFSYIRLDYYHSKGPTQRRAAELKLSWVSAHQAKEVIPTSQLFKGPIIQSALQSVGVVPGVLHAASSVATLPVDDLQAGVTYSIPIVAKDQYGNTLRSSDSNFRATFTKGATTVIADSIPVDATKNDGLYRIPFTLSEGGGYTVTIIDRESSGAISGSGGSVSIIAGVAYSVFAPTLSGSAVAGSPTTILFRVQDAAGNDLDGSILSSIPDVYVSAELDTDSVSVARLAIDDIAVREEKYGTIFTEADISWSSADNRFVATMTLKRAGTYDVLIGVGGGAAPTAMGSALVVTASTTVAGLYSVVVSSNFPPTDLTSGTSKSFTLQVRDQFMNPLGAAATGTNTIVVRLQGVGSDQACLPVGATPGQYTCTITPVVAGPSISLSMLVNGAQASYLYSSNGVVLQNRGPWLVKVSPGAVDATKSVLTGIKKTYSAGVPVDATLVLKDANGNVLGPLDSYPTIAAYVTGGGGFTTETLSTNSFTYNADGSVTIPIVISVAHTALTVHVTVNGNAVTLPYGITTVTCEKGIISSHDTICTSWNASPSVAGTAVTSSCTPEDSEGNSITAWTNLSAKSYFQHRTDADTYLTLSASQAGGVYSFTTGSSLTKTGDYSVYSVLGQPGGLLAQYYSQATFENLMGPSPGVSPSSDSRHIGQAPLYYTKIDPFLDFDYSGPLLIDGQTVRSMKWTGLIMPPATATYNFKVTAVGGVQMQVGTSGYQINATSATSFTDDFDYDLTQNVPVEITILYTTGTPAAFKLSWTFTGSTPTGEHVIPPNVFHAPLRMYNSLSEVTVTVDDVSIQSLAYFSGNITAGQDDLIIVQLKDQYGNSYTTSPVDADCLATGTAPTCFLEVTMTVDDGTDLTAAHLDGGDGTIKVPVVFGADGPKEVNVKLKTSGGNEHIQGSPYSITVNLDSTPS